MSKGQTYDNYYKKYYKINKKKIQERTREYRLKYLNEYYVKNRETLLENARKRYLERKILRDRRKVIEKRIQEELEKEEKVKKFQKEFGVFNYNEKPKVTPIY